MFGPPGCAYVYFTYGMHWMFNIVTGVEGQANAVLLRALEPVEGQSIMTRYRNNMPLEQLSNGPAKLAQALAIDKSLNGTNLCLDNSVIWIEDNHPAKKMATCSGPRVGLGNTPEPWLSIPWRFWIRNNPFVSR
jgi:DNA-3-methyladenine glycosylase